MIYTFVRRLGAPTTSATLPDGYTVDADTPNRACEKFARTFGLKVLELDTESAWVETSDGADVEYLIREEESV